MTRILTFTFLTLFMSGCLVSSRPAHRGHSHSNARAKRDCPPSTHWEGGVCVHNGKGHARGHRR